MEGTEQFSEDIFLLKYTVIDTVWSIQQQNTYVLSMNESDSLKGFLCCFQRRG